MLLNLCRLDSKNIGSWSQIYLKSNNIRCLLDFDMVNKKCADQVIGKNWKCAKRFLGFKFYLEIKLRYVKSISMGFDNLLVVVW